MKKIILGIAMSMLAFTMKAQVPNNSFENLTFEGKIKNWDAVLLLAIAIDSTGNQIDSLVIDQGFYFSTNDAHTGVRALEMRNAKYMVSGEQIAGRAKLSPSDSVYSGFETPVQISGRPSDLTFYYKFLPAGTDTAFAWMHVYNALGDEIGAASMDISLNTNIYTFASSPVIYTSADSAASMEIGFTTAKANSPASYGTRFLVDDVDVLITGIHSPAKDQMLSCFPNPADKFLNVLLSKPINTNALAPQLTDIYGKQYEIPYTVSGKTVRLNTESLAQGVYVITIADGQRSYTTKFIK